MEVLQKAYKLHQRGDIAGAIELYTNFLETNPDHPGANHLAGIAFLGMGRGDDALEKLSRAVDLAPNNPDFQNNYGLTLFYAKDYQKARKHLTRSLELRPESAEPLKNLGLTLEKLEEFDGAILCFKRALEIDSEDWQAHYGMGSILTDLRRCEAAESHLATALELSPSRPEIYSALAKNLMCRGKPEEALTACIDAIALNPLIDGVHQLYGDIQLSLGRNDQVFDSYISACGRHPDDARVHAQLGEAYLGAEIYDLAEPRLRKAVELDGSFARAHGWLGKTLAELERREESISAFETATALDANDADIFHMYGQSLMAWGEIDKAVSVLEVAHNLRPRVNSILATLMIAMTETGDTRMARWLDYDRDIVICEIDVPKGFKTLYDFNRKLHEELAARHREGVAPKDQSLRGGTQIPGNVLSSPEGVLPLAKSAIENTVRDYIDKLEFDEEHPFRRYVNSDFRFTGSWSTILYGDGYDMSHIHTDAWLSGVYYVRVPELSDDQWAAKEGCIQFGAPPDEFLSEKNDARRYFRPEPGKLVLFPSYVWHGVLPFSQRGLRHAIAFDVM